MLTMNTNIDHSITIGDIINMALLFLTILSLIFTAIQLAQTKKINRASLVKELYWTFYDDDEIREVFYIIEWSNYKDDIEVDGYEQKVDKMLSFFEVVCSMYYRKILTKSDMKTFNYEMNRVYAHSKVQEYLVFLDNWQENLSIGESYANYKKYCQEYKKRK